VVTEDLGFSPAESADGEHLWLWVEKRGQNTPWVAQALAQAAGLHPSRASFAGLKDRHAITRQWISLYLGPKPTPDWDKWSIEGVTILQAIRASKKIQRGRLRSNHFELTIRGLQRIGSGDGSGEIGMEMDIDIKEDLERRLAQIQKTGVPNFFGEQRFGGNNVGRARRLFAGELRGHRSKPKRGFYLSAARSYLFNEVLAWRVENERWQQFMPGDVALLDGSQSFFPIEEGQEQSLEMRQRLAAFDIHPTGPLPGIGQEVVCGEVAKMEALCLEPHQDLVLGLVQFKVKAMRRSLRARVSGLEWQWLDDQTLALQFSLGQGAFATTVVRELIAYEA